MYSVTCTRSTNNQALTIPNQRSMRLQVLLFQGSCSLFSALKAPFWRLRLQELQLHHAPLFDGSGIQVFTYWGGTESTKSWGHKMWEEVMEGCFDHEPITHHFVLKEAWNLHNFKKSDANTLLPLNLDGAATAAGNTRCKRGYSICSTSST